MFAYIHLRILNVVGHPYQFSSSDQLCLILPTQCFRLIISFIIIKLLNVELYSPLLFSMSLDQWWLVEPITDMERSGHVLMVEPITDMERSGHVIMVEPITDMERSGHVLMVEPITDMERSGYVLMVEPITDMQRSCHVLMVKPITDMERLDHILIWAFWGL